MAPETLLRTLRELVKDKATEAAQRSAVARELARVGYGRQPSIFTNKAVDGRTVRTYLWKKTPAGDFALVTGPQVEPEIVTGETFLQHAAAAEEQGVYIKGQDVSGTYWKGIADVGKGAVQGRAERPVGERLVETSLRSRAARAFAPPERPGVRFGRRQNPSSDVDCLGNARPAEQNLRNAVGWPLVIGRFWHSPDRWSWGSRFQATPREEVFKDGSRFVPDRRQNPGPYRAKRFVEEEAFEGDFYAPDADLSPPPTVEAEAEEELAELEEEAEVAAEEAEAVEEAAVAENDPDAETIAECNRLLDAAETLLGAFDDAPAEAPKKRKGPSVSTKAQVAADIADTLGEAEGLAGELMGRRPEIHARWAALEELYQLGAQTWILLDELSAFESLQQAEDAQKLYGTIRLGQRTPKTKDYPRGRTPDELYAEASENYAEAKSAFDGLSSEKQEGPVGKQVAAILSGLASWLGSISAGEGELAESALRDLEQANVWLATAGPNSPMLGDPEMVEVLKAHGRLYGDEGPTDVASVLAKWSPNGLPIGVAAAIRPEWERMQGYFEEKMAQRAARAPAPAALVSVEGVPLVGGLDVRWPSPYRHGETLTGRVVGLHPKTGQVTVQPTGSRATTILSVSEVHTEAPSAPPSALYTEAELLRVLQEVAIGHPMQEDREHEVFDQALAEGLVTGRSDGRSKLTSGGSARLAEFRRGAEAQREAVQSSDDAMMAKFAALLERALAGANV